MKKQMTFFALFFGLSFGLLNAQPACADEENIFTFTYNGMDYEVIKENKTWVDAASCAVERGGYLARINSAEEQIAVYAGVYSAGIDNSNTIAPDGGGASYVWLGGNDLAEEGAWYWDGDNNGVGDQFWQGDASGSPVNDLYSNWGTEPDNYSNQDALGLALTEWPLGSGYLGSASQWNDVDHTNALYFVVEFESVGITENSNSFIKVNIYPNPISDVLFVQTKGVVQKITIVNVVGSTRFMEEYDTDFSGELQINNLDSGVYFLTLTLEGGEVSVHKIIVK